MSISMISLLTLLPLLAPSLGTAQETPAHVRELGTERLRHAGRVVVLAHAPGGRELASTTANGEIRLWDATTGDLRAGLDFGESHAIALGFLGPDRLLLGMRDDHLAVLERDGADLVERDPFDVGLGDLVSLGGGLSVAPTGKRAVVWPLTGVGGGAMLADLEGGSRIPLEFLGFRAIGGAWSEDGSRLALLLTNPFKALGRKDTGDQDSARVLLVDAASGEVSTTIYSPDDYLHALAFGPGEGDEALLVGGGDQGLHLWEVDGGRELARFGEVDEARLLDIVTNDEGALMVASNPLGHLEAWQLSADEAPRALLDIDLERPLAALDLAADGEHLLAAEGLAAMRLTLPDLTPDPDLPGHTGVLSSVATAGERIVSCSLDGTVLIWDGDRARRLPRQHVGLVLGADISPDGQLLATCGQDGTLRLWSLAEEDFGTEVFQRRGRNTAAFTAVGFDPAGGRVAATSADGVLWIWGLEEGLLQRSFEGLSGMQFRLAWSADGRRLAVGSSGARVWDTGSWDQVGEFGDLGSPVTALAFGPTGESLGIGLAGRTVQFRRIGDGQRLAVWSDLPSRVASLCWWPGHGFVAATRGSTSTLVLGREQGDPMLLEGARGATPLVLTAMAGGRLLVGDSRGFLHVWK